MVRSVRAEDCGQRDAFEVPFSFGNELGKDERNVDGDKSIIAKGFFYEERCERKLYSSS